MNWYRVFWYFTVADNLKLVCGWLAIVAIAFFIVFVVVRLMNASDAGDRFFDMSRAAKITLFTSLFLGVFNLFAWALLPSKTDALVIICGGAVGNFVTRDSSAAQIPGDLTKYLHRYMQREISELDLDTKKQLGLDTPKDKLIDQAKNLTKEQLLELIRNDQSIKVGD